MHIVIVGTGYVGLVSGACFADMGHDVTCVDSDASKISALQQGIVPFYEPGLEVLVARAIQAGHLTFTTALDKAVAGAEAVFIAVGTPSRKSDGHAELSSVYEVARQIGRAVRNFTVVISKSTVPLGTGDEIEHIVRKERPDADVAVVSNPEFLREGCAIVDFTKPDRIVIGTSNGQARQVMRDIYKPLTKNGAPLLMTERRTAELIKYAANAFLAMKVTFVNEIADLCEEAGADVQDVARGIGLDPRIGERFLQAGPGFGGSCFPKDTLALIKTAQDYGRPLRLIETTIAVNDQRKRVMARKVVAACGGSVRDRTIAVLGLTFKPDTDDMRGAPSLDIIRALQDQGARIKAYDPFGMNAARPLLEDVEFCASCYSAGENADALVLVTEWEHFRDIEFDRMRNVMNRPILVDLRNVYHPADVARHGFEVISIGKPARKWSNPSNELASVLLTMQRHAIDTQLQDFGSDKRVA